MADFVRIPISSIHIGERQRPIDQDHALAIAASMEQRGLINPITVRSTPNQNKGKTPYTLVAGGHRVTGATILEWTEIDAMLVQADAAEAQLIEISENLFRNDLTALNRALFVAKFREVFEEQHGTINRQGGRPRKQGNDYPVFFAGGRELSSRVQKRLGIGHETFKLVNRIAQNLHPNLRQALRGTDIENDQSKLLKLAKFDPDLQVKIAAAIVEGSDYATVMSWAKPPKADGSAADPQDAIFSRLTAIWDTANDATRRRFLDHIGDAEDFSFLEEAA